MKTLADFKRELRPGRRIKTTYHMKCIGYTPAENQDREPDDTVLPHRNYPQPIYGDEDKGISEVARVRSNDFSVFREKNGEKVESFCSYPKKDEYKIEDNKFIILRPDLRGLYGDMNEVAKTAPKIKVLTYEFVD
jgi:hypothetical protein